MEKPLHMVPNRRENIDVNKEYAMTLQHFVTSLRQGRGWSQGELAEHCQQVRDLCPTVIDIGTLRGIEAGETTVGPAELHNLATALDVPAVWLYELSGVDRTLDPDFA